jgi:hypothetical protein
MVVRRRRLDLTTRVVHSTHHDIHHDISDDDSNNVAACGGEQDLDDTENTEGLSIAILVSDEQISCLPVATEYDPSADRLPVKKARQTCNVAGIISLVLFGVMAWGVWCIAVGPHYRHSKSTTPTASESEKRAGLGFRERLELLIDSNQFENRFSAYSRALWWITYADPMKLLPDDPYLFQRYLLAYVYYATSQERPWKSCNPPNVDVGETQLCTNNGLYVSGELVTARPVPGQIRWLSDQPECTWTGVFCDELGQVRYLKLGK